MTPAALIARLEAELPDYGAENLQDLAHFFSLLYGQRYVAGPADAARALLSGLPKVLAVLEPVDRDAAKQTLLNALEAADVGA
jgi:hypothetical protein